MTEDEAAQQARARELRAEIERLKRGPAEVSDAGSQPADEPDAATGADAGSDATEADPAGTTSVRDWINKRMDETPFEEELEDDADSTDAAETGGGPDAHEGDQSTSRSKPETPDGDNGAAGEGGVHDEHGDHP